MIDVLELSVCKAPIDCVGPRHLGKDKEISDPDIARGTAKLVLGTA
jgi:hypothetical protein